MQSKNVSTFWRSRQVLDYNDQNTKSPSCNKSLYTLKQTKKSFLPPKNGGVQNHLFKETKTKISFNSQFYPYRSPQFICYDITSKICDAQLQISPNKRFMLKFTVDRNKKRSTN